MMALMLNHGAKPMICDPLVIMFASPRAIDIIASVARATPRPLVIGFAAETNNTLENARAKRLRKGIDAIVLNDVADASIGFNSPENAATLIYAGGEVAFPKQSKELLARSLIGQILEIFASQLADTNRETVTK